MREDDNIYRVKILILKKIFDPIKAYREEYEKVASKMTCIKPYYEKGLLLNCINVRF